MCCFSGATDIRLTWKHDKLALDVHDPELEGSAEGEWNCTEHHWHPTLQHQGGEQYSLCRHTTRLQSSLFPRAVRAIHPPTANNLSYRRASPSLLGTVVNSSTLTSCRQKATAAVSLFGHLCQVTNTHGKSAAASRLLGEVLILSSNQCSYLLFPSACHMALGEKES